MKKIVLLLTLALIVGIGYFYLRHPLGEKVIINGHAFTVEVAVTNTEKQKGLSGRDSLASDSGMLFIYQSRDRYGFWMKGMRFPLDFIWIDGNTVVDLSENIPAPATPGEQPVEIAPKVPASKVLEVNAGTIRRLGVHVGDTAQFTD